MESDRTSAVNHDVALMWVSSLFFSGGRRLVPIMLICALLTALPASGAAPAQSVLVADGRPRSVIVLDETASAFARLAAEELQAHVRRASGAELPIVSVAEAARLPREQVRLVIGAGKLAEKLGVDAAALQPEEYRVKSVGNTILFVGHDVGQYTEPASGASARSSPATLWAVCHVLDRHLGVRWLWPGETGTYVPKRKTIALPHLDVTARPSLEQRVLRVFRASLPAAVAGESTRWHFHHQLGSRTSYRFGHSFGAWWQRYADAHPDYFATPPPGQPQLANKEWVKLCVSNPAVADRILEEWRAAGRPDNWSVGPNDGSGFCTCERCRALDGLPDQQPEEIWRSSGVNLTGRYVALWNTLMRRMKLENPNATLSSYAYSAYRTPPSGTKLEAGIVLGVVHTYWAYDEWRRWHDAGARLFLRPNWWHTGAVAPHLPLHRAGDYFRFARAHSMIGFDFDALLGSWGTQGPYYYLIARLSVRPDLTVDEVIAEYASAFGPAAGAIRRYLDHWEAFTERAAYPVPAGGSVVQNPEGLYAQACRRHSLPDHPLAGSWRVLPYLYTDAVLAKAQAILGEADAAAGSDVEVRARIRFLRDGLTYLKLTRDVIALAYAPRLPEGVTAEDLKRKSDELRDLGRDLTPRHVVWGPVVRDMMRLRGIRPEAGSSEAGDLKGR